MKRLIIIGAGGFGREMLGWIGQSDFAFEMEIGGFLDCNPAALHGFAVSRDDCFICAIGDPKTKLRICYGIHKRGGSFISYIHRTAVIGPQCNIGEGCVLCPYSVITTNVALGRFVTLNLAATVGHDAVVGDGTTLSCHCDVTGGATIGTGVFLGSHAVVLPKSSVGDFATVGAGSVVLRKAKAYTTVFGVPAKRVMVARDASRIEYSK
jgi:sugar O-acyltransferase (sialic acid O-acetyltransferase NeuD family)